MLNVPHLASLSNISFAAGDGSDAPWDFCAADGVALEDNKEEAEEDARGRRRDRSSILVDVIDPECCCRSDVSSLFCFLD